MLLPPWLTMVDKAFANHGQPWLTKVDNAFANHGQPWLTKVPFYKPMVDHGLWKHCQTMVNHGCQCFLTSMVNPGWLKVSFPTFSQWKLPGWTRLVQVPSLIVENRYKVSLLTRDSFVQSGVQWLHKGKFISLQICIKMIICVKPICLYRHILWCQVSKVGSVWKWNN